MIVGPKSKSVFVERSAGKKERAEVDILGLRQKDEKCVLFEQLRGAAATIYWEEINRTISFCLDPYTRILNFRRAPEEDEEVFLKQQIGCRFYFDTVSLLFYCLKN